MAEGRDQLKEALASLNVQRGRKGKDDEDEAKHAFWDTQPVPAMSDDTDSLQEGQMGPIDAADPTSVRKAPYNLPEMFQWTDVNLDSEEQAMELYQLLHDNYVEDGDNMFRFDYSVPFLRWAMQPPGYLPEWHAGVRVRQTGKLVAYIGCTPAELFCHGVRVEPGAAVAPVPQADPVEEEGVGDGDGDDEYGHLRGREGGSAVNGLGSIGDAVVEVNFLCVHKKLRSKRLAPVLIREITRRVNLHGIFQACYTAGVVLPKPVARCRYYHRSLNPKKLIEARPRRRPRRRPPQLLSAPPAQVGFSRLAPRMTMVRTIKLYALPDAPQSRGLRPLREARRATRARPPLRREAIRCASSPHA
jgi:glycylpeptide N-tetradecanoyltransferase